MPSRRTLERTLSLRSSVAITISAMLGSGIFVLPGLAAADAGSLVWLAYLLAAICVIPAALSKAELATAMPTSGGTYVYMERAFGPLAGTIAGLGLWLSLLLKSAFSLVGFGAYLSVVTTVPHIPMALGLLAGIVAINIFGAKKVGQTQTLVLLIVLPTLISIVAVALGSPIPAEVPVPFVTFGTDGLLAATALVFVSYAGVTGISAIAEEVKDPGRNLPKTIVISLLCVAGLYALLSFVLVNSLPVEAIGDDIRPMYSLALSSGGVSFAVVVSIVAVLALTSMANTGVLASSRFPFAMSRDGLLPPALHSLNPRFLTPVSCIVFTGAMMTVAILTLDVIHIAKLASAFKVLMFIGVNAAAIVLRETGVRWYRPTFRSPYYPVLQIFGIVSGVVLLFALGVDSLIAIGFVHLLGLFVYFLYGRRRVARKSVFRLYGERALGFLRERRSIIKELKVEPERDLELSMPTLPGYGDLSAPEAAVFVPLLGQERSPEMLIEIGAGLARGGKVEAIALKELPYQTSLDALEGPELKLESLERRLKTMADEEQIDLQFDSVVTHELAQAIQELSEQSHCGWLLLEWAGGEGRAFLVQNPVGWLMSHLSCPVALFRDAGVRYIRKILVYTNPGEHGRLVAEVSNQLAAIYDAELTFVRVVTPRMDENEQLRREEFLNDLKKASDAKAKTHLARADNSVDAIINLSVSYDLVVFGTPWDQSFFGALTNKGRDRITEEAACSVLRLTPSRKNKAQPFKIPA